MRTKQRPDAGTRPAPETSPAGAATMRAAVQHRYGPPSVLESSEVGLPLPGQGDVLVQVGAASVHPGDYFVMTGEPYVVRLAFGLRRPRHGIPGRDLAGVVAAVGTDVTAHRPGEEVFGWSTAGTLAEYACVPASPSDDRTDENDPTRAYARPDLPPLRRTDRSSRRKNR